MTTNPGVDWYRRYGLTCRSESGSVQGRCRLPDGMATRRDARESARQCMSALAGVSQKGYAGKTAEERALLCRRTACKFDAATTRRLTALPATVSDPDRLAEVGDLIISTRRRPICWPALRLADGFNTGARALAAPAPSDQPGLLCRELTARGSINRGFPRCRREWAWRTLRSL